MKSITYSLILISSVLIGCKKDVKTNTLLDKDLSALLASKSPSQHSSFYELPGPDELYSIPFDSKNPLSRQKIELGKLLFHETGLGNTPKNSAGIQTFSCSSCHHAGGGFQAGTIQGIGDGGIGYGISGEARTMHPSYSELEIDVQPLKSPSALNSAYQTLMLWNGQFGSTDQNIGTEAYWSSGTPKEVNLLGYEGIETQAIAGLEVHRLSIDTSFLFSNGYREWFDLVFSDFPLHNRYSNETAGLAIAAFERSLLSNQAPFQKWLKGNHESLTAAQKKGAIVFFGKGECVSCHTGPALSSMEFHALGLNDFNGIGTLGKLPDEATKKGRGGFTQKEEDNYKFKVPQLYSLKYNTHFGHGSSQNSIEAIIRYKNLAKKENSDVPDQQLSSHFHPLNLNTEEIEQLIDFVQNGLDDPNLSRYEPASILSGNCFPNNDLLSKIDLNCN